MYVLYIGASQYLKQILTIKEENNTNTVIVGDFNTLIFISRSSRQKTNKETQALKETSD